MKVRIYKSDGTTEDTTVKSFNDIENLVGGHFDVLTLRLSDNHPIPCAVNEMGQALKLPANPHATITYPNTPIPPNAIILGEPLPHICGDFVALPSDWLAQLDAELER